jgi:hypothetical protein
MNIRAQQEIGHANRLVNEIEGPPIAETSQALTGRQRFRADEPNVEVWDGMEALFGGFFGAIGCKKRMVQIDLSATHARSARGDCPESRTTAQGRVRFMADVMCPEPRR